VQREDLTEQPFIRVGLYAWGLVGVSGALVILAWVFTKFHIVTVPLVLMLFPAAVLAPIVSWLKRNRVPKGAAAGIGLILVLGVGSGIVALIVQSIQAQGPELVESVQAGYEELRTALEEGLFGLPAVEIEQLLEQAQEFVVEGLGDQIAAALATTVEGLTGFGFGLVALFFYLRDGDRIGLWMRNLFPAEQRDHVSEIGSRAWQAVGGYVRGQSIVALVDAVAIGIGLAILGVPLALVLSILVFFGGYVPVVGAFVTGALAVLVALAAEGPIVALMTLGLIVAVQQMESNLLAPLVVGRSVALHPLAVLSALTVGAILYGIIGAIVAVPTAAAIWRAGSYIREMSDGRTDPEVEEDGDGDDASHEPPPLPVGDEVTAGDAAAAHET
jgi:putative heme transporter